MHLPKYRRRIVVSCLAILAATSAATLVVVELKRAKDYETQERYARDYQSVLNQQTDRTGPPLARVLSADRGEPVCDVVVCLTLIGPDGGDGGFQCFVTDTDGVAHRHLRLAPGRYQHHLMPDPKSRFGRTYRRRGQQYVVISQDGTSIIPTLHLDVDSGR